ncbi:MAG: efflux RND transporter periplasmic adaptor subunit [Anaerolineae bacterium]|nr:efflux RND transporter periplasmic adaptor subunit [Anaerolineae bacterium]
MKNKMSVLVFTLVVLGLALSACGGGAAAPTPTSAVVTPVKASAATIAEASVVPEKSANLVFSATGIVDEILVPEGSVVKEGDPIARLQGQERLQAALAAANLQVVSAQQSLDNLTDNGAVSKANAELNLANAEKVLKDAKKDLEKVQYRRGTHDQINEAQAKYILTQDGVKQAEDAYMGFEGMSDDNLNKAAALQVLAGARRARDHALAELNYMLDKPDQYDLNIATSKVDVAQAQVDAAKREVDKLNSDGVSKDALELADVSLKNAKAQAAAAEEALDDLTLKAPFGGVVVANNLKVGETVSPSAGTAQVVLADVSSWKIETTDLTELNINEIAEGDAVTVTFDALPGLELAGKVQSIQSLGQNKQGDITYKVTVTLDQQDERLRWNMTALVAFPTK